MTETWKARDNDKSSGNHNWDCKWSLWSPALWRCYLSDRRICRKVNVEVWPILIRFLVQKQGRVTQDTATQSSIPASESEQPAHTLASGPQLTSDRADARLTDPVQTIATKTTPESAKLTEAPLEVALETVSANEQISAPDARISDPADVAHISNLAENHISNVGDVQISDLSEVQISELSELQNQLASNSVHHNQREVQISDLSEVEISELSNIRNPLVSNRDDQNQCEVQNFDLSEIQNQLVSNNDHIDQPQAGQTMMRMLSEFQEAANRSMQQDEQIQITENRSRQQNNQTEMTEITEQRRPSARPSPSNSDQSSDSHISMLLQKLEVISSTTCFPPSDLQNLDCWSHHSSNRRHHWLRIFEIATHVPKFVHQRAAYPES